MGKDNITFHTPRSGPELPRQQRRWSTRAANLVNFCRLACRPKWCPSDVPDAVEGRKFSASRKFLYVCAISWTAPTRTRALLRRRGRPEDADTDFYLTEFLRPQHAGTGRGVGATCEPVNLDGRPRTSGDTGRRRVSPAERPLPVGHFEGRFATGG